VYSLLDRFQETLRRENEALVSFLDEIGRILGHMQLTQAMFAASGQDIMSFCRSVHNRVVIQGRAGVSASGLLGHPDGGRSGSFPGSRGDSGTMPSVQGSGQWFLGGAAGNASSMGLQGSYLMHSLGGSVGMELGDAAGQLLHGKSTVSGMAASGAYADRVRLAAAAMSKRPASPGSRRQAFMHDSPFLYGPDGAAATASAQFHVSPMSSKDFRPAKVMKTAAVANVTGGVEAGVGAIAGPADRQNSFVELLRAFNDTARNPAANGGSGSIVGLPSAAAIAAALSPRNPAELLDTLNQMSAPTVKGLVSLIASQSAGCVHPAGVQAGAATGSAAPNTLVSDLEQLLNSKEGSRTLDLLTRDLSVSRALSAGELMSIPMGLDISGHAAIHPSPRPPSSLAQPPVPVKADPLSMAASPAQPPARQEACQGAGADAAVTDAQAVVAPETAAASQRPVVSTVVHAAAGGAVTSGTRSDSRRMVRSTQVTSGQLPLDQASSQGPQ
jgi:hypothetical protein